MEKQEHFFVLENDSEPEPMWYVNENMVVYNILHAKKYDSYEKAAKHILGTSWKVREISQSEEN